MPSTGVPPIFSPSTSRWPPAEHEDRFTEQPQEVVNGFPRRVHLRQRLAAGHRDVADHVAEAEDQTAADQRRQQREEDLGEVGDGALGPVMFWRAATLACSLSASLTPVLAISA